MKILFISHNAHRAGAQLLLLNFLKWLKINKPQIDIHVLLLGGGKLTEEFKLFERLYIYKKNKSLKNNILNLLIDLKMFFNQYELIYANTALSQNILNKIFFFKIPKIIHIHEMNYWLSIARFTYNEKYKYIAASNAVKLCLVNKYNANTKNIKVIYEHINVKNTLSQKSDIQTIICIPSNAFVVAACGVESERKGKDLFIPIAERFLQEHPNPLVHFVWIGGKLDHAIALDYEKSAYKNQIHFIPTIPNASTYFHAFDLFLMLSREDPFPTVNLEVGLHGVPIICFENAGGTQELIQNDAGIAVPMEDVGQVATAIAFLQQNEDKRQQMGQILKNRVVRNYDIEIIASKIYIELMKLYSH